MTDKELPRNEGIFRYLAGMGGRKVGSIDIGSLLSRPFTRHVKPYGVRAALVNESLNC